MISLSFVSRPGTFQGRGRSAHPSPTRPTSNNLAKPIGNIFRTISNYRIFDLESDLTAGFEALEIRRNSIE